MTRRSARSPWIRQFAALGVSLLPLLGSGVRAQVTPPPEPRGMAGLAPAEVLRLLDAYAVMQAQEALHLDEKQYPPFVLRFKQLQDVRRQHLQTRARLVQDLNQLTRPAVAAIDESAIRQKIAELAALEAAAATEVSRARAAVDEVLSVVQQGRFRVFEEQMERRKLELLSRARQNARQERRRVPTR